MNTSSSGRRRLRWMTLALLCTSVLIVTVDSTILNVALPTLVADLGATDSELQWIVDAYALALACLVLIAGSVADRIGRKRMLVTGIATFAAASLWAAYSGSVPMLVAARAGMGAGAAMIMPSTLAVITDLFPDRRERQQAMGVWGAMSGLGVALGPIAGGLLLSRYEWGSVFLVNVPVAAVALIGVALLVVESRDPHPRRPDLPGALASVSGMALLLWAIIEAPEHGWASGLVIGTGTAGLAVLGAFVLWERAVDQPMLDLRLFHKREFAAPIAVLGLNFFALFGALFVITQFLQFHLGYEPVSAGIRIIPTAGGLIVAAGLSTRVVHLVGPRIPVTIGLASIGVGLWTLSRLDVGDAYAASVPGLVLIGMGAGLVMPTCIGLVVGSAPRSQSGVASGTGSVALQLGAALGVAVVGSLVSTRYQDRMTGALDASPVGVGQEVADTVLGSLGGALQVAARVKEPLAGSLREAAHEAFLAGSALGLAAAAAVAAVACLFAVFAMPGRRTAPLSAADLESVAHPHDEIALVGDNDPIHAARTRRS
ncbi:MAG: DHA2 family efflux MFS transporter permease subunit [Micromonosporaceae bacterium]|nr:DHA2 family efflux MFS transporter permease subunit [Micromonosporaceae bacterium]